MLMNKGLLLLMLCATVLLQGCGATWRDVQHTTNAYNIYKDSTVREEVVWKIRTLAGQ